MEDPGKALGADLQKRSEVLALRAQVKEGQRLLELALRQRDEAIAGRDRNWKIISKLQNHWSSIFHPRLP